jgi:flagellar basal body P-ring formation protein FlgA
MRILGLLLSVLTASSAWAENVVATRTIRANSILTEQDLTMKPAHLPGAFDDPALLIGMETRVVLYAGRPVLEGDVGPPSIIDRNQIVLLIYKAAGLTITTEARALGRGGVGDRLRVLNISSRLTVEGEIRPDGSVLVH